MGYRVGALIMGVSSQSASIVRTPPDAAMDYIASTAPCMPAAMLDRLEMSRLRRLKPPAGSGASEDCASNPRT